MKKLTMTRVLTPLAALAFTLGAQAADYAKDDFEEASVTQSRHPRPAENSTYKSKEEE